MRIAIEHRTRYVYDDDVAFSVQNLRLTPPSFDGQQVVEWRIETTPAVPLARSWDGFGNETHLVALTGLHRGVEIVASGVVDVEDRMGVVRGLADPTPLRVFLRHTPLTTPTQEIIELVDAVAPDETIQWSHALMAAIRDRVEYVAGATDSQTEAAAALRAGKGVCQDHAHIFIACARRAGLPARYVTGYLLLDDAEQSVAHHAWAEVHVEGLGWLGFDVANRICPTNRYVRLASALDAHYAAPIRGTRRGGERESLDVSVRVHESDQQ